MKNEYEIRGEVTAIFLNHKGKEIETLIDTDDLPKLSGFINRWYANQTPKGFNYARTNVVENGRRKVFKLHRVVMDATEGLFVDHINHNTLDNRKSNLRVCTNAENLQNFDRARKTSKSGILGVYYHKRANLWIASVGKMGHKRNHKSFKTLEEAKEAITIMRAELLPYSQEAMQ